jgi:4-hydroxy-tetrahydrodipicolinate reductase
VATNTAAILSDRAHVTVLGPFGRDARDQVLRSGADVVVIATTSFLAQVADDIHDAVDAGSNVITTAEEAAYPWGNDVGIARQLDALARSRGVSILGTGLNPGFVFDAMVLTAAGVVERLDSVSVERVVDLSGFGEAVLSRIGVGHSPEAFADGVRRGTVTGHIGFPQSMRVVAGRLGVEIERIERDLEPILAVQEHATKALRVKAGETAGFRQRYVALSRGQAWFEASFLGHVAPVAFGEEPRDAITIASPSGELRFTVSPGTNPQRASAAVVANSVRRVIAALPGWVTVGELPPATPE